MTTAGQRLRHEAWRSVKVNFAEHLQGESEQEDAVVAVLRRNFRDGPAAAADAHAAYKSWVHGVVETGGSEPMPPAARRWSEFLDRLWESRLSIAEIDGVDFSQVQKPELKQRPKMRMRM